MRTVNTEKSIKEQLDEVQARILENEELQMKYPTYKNGLLIALKTLKQLENGIWESLKRETALKNHEIYEIHLTGDKVQTNIPMKELGRFLIEEQDMINSFASEDGLKKQATIPPDIINNSQLNVVATAGGSFKILLKSPQTVLVDLDKADSIVKHAFDDIQKIVDCGDDEELLKKEGSRLGSKKLSAYKEVLELLYEKEMNMGISTFMKNEDVPIVNIRSSKAKTIHNTLIKRKKTKPEHIKVTGTIRAFDFTTLTHSFKIVVKEGKKTKNLKVFFNEKFDDIILENINKLSKVELLMHIRTKGIGETPSYNYELVKFLD